MPPAPDIVPLVGAMARVAENAALCCRVGDRVRIRKLWVPTAPDRDTMRVEVFDDDMDLG